MDSKTQTGSQSYGQTESNQARTQSQNLAEVLTGRTGTYVATAGNCAFLVTVNNGSIQGCIPVSGGPNNWHLRQVSNTPIDITSDMGNFGYTGSQQQGQQQSYEQGSQTARGASNSS